MAKFSEVLGGIAKDFVQLQVSSDLASVEALTHYKDNVILKFLDAPRFKVSDIKLNLKFAISEQEPFEQTEQAIKYVETEWLNTLRNEVFQNIIATFSELSDVEKKKIVFEFEKAASKIEEPRLDIRKALGSKPSDAISKSTSYLVKAYKNLSTKHKNKVGTATEFKKRAREKLKVLLEENLPSLKRLASAKSAVERDMEIIIEKEALENIPDSQIHEISFNLTPDFIRFAQNEGNE